MAPYLEPQAKEVTINEMIKTIDWLYGEGEESTYEEYIKRWKAFMLVIEPTKKRYLFYTEVEDRFKMFADACT